MDTIANASAEHRTAFDVLKKLDALGAINLDVLVSKSSEIKSIAGMAGLEPGEICYLFNLHIGPRRDFDLVTVADQVKQLGFELKRAAGPR
ncbi:MAG: hypothetical protein LCI02_02485 [Proteobacteria bacterium]|nr:hypothetical protein [Pseudomonadota bacterium]